MSQNRTSHRRRQHQGADRDKFWNEQKNCCDDFDSACHDSKPLADADLIEDHNHGWLAGEFRHARGQKGSRDENL